MRWLLWTVLSFSAATACGENGGTHAGGGNGGSTTGGVGTTGGAVGAGATARGGTGGQASAGDSSFGGDSCSAGGADGACCGNFEIEAGETCDPPNARTCTRDCQAHHCGNGVVEPSETCDPPNDTDCNPTCLLSRCGNSQVELGESCDPPNTRDCSATCQASICGNGVLEQGEACEPAGEGGCSWWCETTCGNGALDPGETCDPPNALDCSFDCRVHACGNGIMESSETCDPPNGVNCGGDCRLIPGQGCPNTVDTILQSAVTCGDDQRYLSNECGDNCEPITVNACLACERWYQNFENRDCEYLIGDAEAGPMAGTARAVLCRQALECMRRTNCGARFPSDCYCGKGDKSCFKAGADGPCKTLLEAAFETSSPVAIGAHLTDLSLAGGVAMVRMEWDAFQCRGACFGTCGNGRLEPGETCDPPNDGTCSANCEAHVCGNGVLEQSEFCDPPNAIDCAPNCRYSSCGNGVLEPGEDCDPPNATGCSLACHICGNGAVEYGENCDPPNSTNCGPECQLSNCGNSAIEVGESCDPPNSTDCSLSCHLHTCGNGVVESSETCDPPNEVDCSADCRAHACGNGLIESSETCDPPNGASCAGDCSLVPGRGCPNTISNLAEDAVSCTAADQYLVNNCGDNCAPIDSDACLRCERELDIAGVPDCDAALGNAVGGAQAGTPRAVLCRKALECMQRTNCMASALWADDFPCYCGDSKSECPTKGGDGVCRDIVEASLETTDPKELWKRTSDLTYGGAIAWQRMMRHHNFCFNACFASCGDGVLEEGETCEPPNDSDCSANCIRHVCGNGIIEPPELCDPPDGDYCLSTCQPR